VPSLKNASATSETGKLDAAKTRPSSVAGGKGNTITAPQGCLGLKTKRVYRRGGWKTVEIPSAPVAPRSGAPPKHKCPEDDSWCPCLGPCPSLPRGRPILKGARPTATWAKVAISQPKSACADCGSPFSPPSVRALKWDSAKFCSSRCEENSIPESWADDLEDDEDDEVFPPLAVAAPKRLPVPAPAPLPTLMWTESEGISLWRPATKGIIPAPAAVNEEPAAALAPALNASFDELLSFALGHVDEGRTPDDEDCNPCVKCGACEQPPLLDEKSLCGECLDSIYESYEPPQHEVKVPTSPVRSPDFSWARHENFFPPPPAAVQVSTASNVSERVPLPSSAPVKAALKVKKLRSSRKKTVSFAPLPSPNECTALIIHPLRFAKPAHKPVYVQKHLRVWTLNKDGSRADSTVYPVRFLWAFGKLKCHILFPENAHRATILAGPVGVCSSEESRLGMLMRRAASITSPFLPGPGQSQSMGSEPVFSIRPVGKCIVRRRRAHAPRLPSHHKPRYPSAYDEDLSAWVVDPWPIVMCPTDNPAAPPPLILPTPPLPKDEPRFMPGGWERVCKRERRPSRSYFPKFAPPLPAVEMVAHKPKPKAKKAKIECPPSPPRCHRSRSPPKAKRPDARVGGVWCPHPVYTPFISDGKGLERLAHVIRAICSGTLRHSRHRATTRSPSPILRSTIKSCMDDLLSRFDPALAAALFADLTKVRGVTALAHNRAMHAGNGNIDGIESTLVSSNYQIAGEVTTSAKEHLAGAIPVLTESLFSISNGTPARINVDSFDDTMLRHRFGLSGHTTDHQTLTPLVGCMTAPNRYLRSFPLGSGRLPIDAHSDTVVRILASARNSIRSVVERMPTRKNAELGGPTELKSSAVSAYWMHDPEIEALKRADAALINRFAGTRGNRVILGWEAQHLNRAGAFRTMALADSEGGSYYRFMARLWTYFALDCISTASETTWGPNNSKRWTLTNAILPADLAYNPNGQRVSQRISLIPIGARLNLGAPGAVNVNPEELLMGENYYPDAIAELSAGQAHFLDVENMSDEEIQLAIVCLTAKDEQFRVSWHHTATDVRYEALVDRWHEAPDNVPNKIYLHYGARPCPTQAAAETLLLGRAAIRTDPGLPALSPWGKYYTRGLVGRLITHFIRKHHCAADAWNAFDAVIYRFGGYSALDLPSTRANANGVPLSAFGERGFKFPPDVTITGYFDTFRYPMSMESDAPDVLKVLNGTSSALCWTGFYACHALASSLAWPAYAFSMRQEEWQYLANPLPAANEYLKNHVSAFTKTLYSTELNPWTAMVAKSCAFMYSFSPCSFTLMTTAQLVEPLFLDNCVPWLANPYHSMWMVKYIPNFMVLPGENEVPSWPDNQPKPVFSASESSQPRVRLARNLHLFTGRAFVQDGGMMANAQFYAAAPHARGTFRSDPGEVAGVPLSIGVWNSPFEYEWPTNPVEFAPVYLGAAGTLFGNALLPGSLQSYSVRANRIRAIGVRINQANWTSADAFTDMTLEKRQAGVAIRYVMPAPFKVELPPVNQYTTLIFTDVDTGYYRNMSIVQGAATASLSLETPSTYTATTAGFAAELANHNAPNILPSALANHNSPHAPAPDGSLAQHLQSSTAARRPAAPIVRPSRPSPRASARQAPVYTAPGEWMAVAKRTAKEVKQFNNKRAEAAAARKLQIEADSAAAVAASSKNTVEEVAVSKPLIAPAATTLVPATRPLTRLVPGQKRASIRSGASIGRPGVAATYTPKNPTNLSQLAPKMAAAMAPPPVKSSPGAWKVLPPKVSSFPSAKKMYVASETAALQMKAKASQLQDDVNAYHMAIVDAADKWDNSYNEALTEVALPARGEILSNPNRVIATPIVAADEVNDGAAIEVQAKWAPDPSVTTPVVDGVILKGRDAKVGVLPVSSGSGHVTATAADDWQDFDAAGLDVDGVDPPPLN